MKLLVEMRSAVYQGSCWSIEAKMVVTLGTTAIMRIDTSTVPMIIIRIGYASAEVTLPLSLACDSMNWVSRSNTCVSVPEASPARTMLM